MHLEYVLQRRLACPQCFCPIYPMLSYCHFFFAWYLISVTISDFIQRKKKKILTYLFWKYLQAVFSLFLLLQLAMGILYWSGRKNEFYPIVEWNYSALNFPVLKFNGSFFQCSFSPLKKKTFLNSQFQAAKKGCQSKQFQCDLLILATNFDSVFEM